MNLTYMAVRVRSRASSFVEKKNSWSFIQRERTRTTILSTLSAYDRVFYPLRKKKNFCMFHTALDIFGRLASWSTTMTFSMTDNPFESNTNTHIRLTQLEHFQCESSPRTRTTLLNNFFHVPVSPHMQKKSYPLHYNVTKVLVATLMPVPLKLHFFNFLLRQPFIPHFAQKKEFHIKFVRR